MLQLIVTELPPDRPPLPCYRESCEARSTFAGVVKGGELPARYRACDSHVVELLVWYGARLQDDANRPESVRAVPGE